MLNARCLSGGLPFFAALLCSAVAYPASPILTAIEPHGGQRGAELEVSFVGDRLSDAQEILFYYPGIELLKIEKAEDREVKCRLKIAADCRLGEHAMRVRTATGISDLRAFYVGALPAVAEQEPNNDISSPQKIDLNVTVNAIGDREDIDYYQVAAKKGQPLVVEIEAMRLGNAIFDPVVAIFDSEQTELITADDTPLAWQDAVAAIVAPKDGNYTIAVRESSYAGSRSAAYRLHVGTFPRPLAAYPAGGKLGDQVDVRFVGDAAGELTQTIKLPAVADPRFGLFAQSDRGISPSPVGFRLSEVGNVLEAEPNNAQKEATSAELPLALNGVISSAGDVDYFHFKAAKGTVYDVQCYARRLRTPLDPVLAIERIGGGTIAGNDDGAGLDAVQRFTAPADGEYAIRVTDQLGRGGPEYVYRIEFAPVQPTLTLSVPKTGRYTQERQVATVPRGNRFAFLVTASRTNFSGDLLFGAAGLPAGVTVSADTLPANVNAVPVLFEAAADAPVAGTLSKLT
ncbi:MAG: peptidase, partial [Planctomycetes bacterium]|nr:peptidase [Planctomycetota bacterium]